MVPPTPSRSPHHSLLFHSHSQALRVKSRFLSSLRRLGCTGTVFRIVNIRICRMTFRRGTMGRRDSSFAELVGMLYDSVLFLPGLGDRAISPACDICFLGDWRGDSTMGCLSLELVYSCACISSIREGPGVSNFGLLLVVSCLLPPGMWKICDYPSPGRPFSACCTFTCQLR